MTYTLAQARMGMRLKTRMLNIAEDMPGLYRGRMGCKACSPLNQGKEGPEAMETVEHLKECEGYAHLWGDTTSDKAIIDYFLRVMREREDTKK